MRGITYNIRIISLKTDIGINMKLPLSLLLLSTATHAQITYHNCPLAGDNPRTASKDSLKNRYEIPASYKALSFDEVAAMKEDDTSIYPAMIEGYVILVKNGGKETCNCHSGTDEDIHIEITRDSSINDPKQAIICEVNPRMQAITGYNTKELRKTFLHHKVRIYGYLFSDSEHKQNSAVDEPEGTDIWRISTKEIHPITLIQILN